MKKYLFGVAILLSFVLVGSFALKAEAAPAPLSGWAWSSNIGWISFNSINSSSGSTYSVVMDDVSGALTGWAWSSNIGWISFTPSVNSTCPVQTQDDGNCAARVNLTNGKVQGWARAIAGCQKNLWNGSACTGGGSGDDNGVAGVTGTTGPLVWTEHTPSGSHYWFSIASSADSAKLVAVDGWPGYIYTSTDSGVTWTERATSGSRTWSKVTSSADGTKLAAVALSGSVYTSPNSGANWTEHALSGASGLYSVTSSADGTKLVAVDGNASGYIYTSSDSGLTWTQRTGAGGRNWYDVTSSADGTKLAAVAGVSSNYIYTSIDSGVTWTERTGSGARGWSAITSSADGTKLAATNYYNSGYIYTSSDSGLTWTQRTGPGAHIWWEITSSSDGTKLAASDGNGYIYTSTDSGANWTQVTSLGSAHWYGITSSSDGTKLAAANGAGQIYTAAPDQSTGTTGGAGGWDGWIHLSGLNHTSPDTSGHGGVTYREETTMNGSVQETKKIFNGYAWGGQVVGWVDFASRTDTFVCLSNLANCGGTTVMPITGTCLVSPSTNPVAANTPMTFTATPTNGTGPYEYNWGSGYVLNLNTHGRSAGTSGIIGLVVTIKDSTGNTGTAPCPNVTVSQPGSNLKLMIDGSLDKLTASLLREGKTPQTYFGTGHGRLTVQQGDDFMFAWAFKSSYRSCLLYPPSSLNGVSWGNNWTTGIDASQSFAYSPQLDTTNIPVGSYIFRLECTTYSDVVDRSNSVLEVIDTDITEF